jgi:hypothetical protein
MTTIIQIQRDYIAQDNNKMTIEDNRPSQNNRKATTLSPGLKIEQHKKT